MLLAVPRCFFLQTPSQVISTGCVFSPSSFLPLSPRPDGQWEDDVHQRVRAGPVHARGVHAVGKLRDQQHPPGQNHADPVRRAAPGGPVGAVRRVGRPLRGAAALLHDLPRPAEHQVRPRPFILPKISLSVCWRGEGTRGAGCAVAVSLLSPALFWLSSASPRAWLGVCVPNNFGVPHAGRFSTP